MTADMIVASACLPHLFRAVEIDGEAYWDGGYVGNPALYPLNRLHADREFLAFGPDQSGQAQTNSETQGEILAPINEITFNSSLMSELRGLTFVGKLINEGKLPREIGEGKIPAHQRAPGRAHRCGTDTRCCQSFQHRL